MPRKRSKKPRKRASRGQGSRPAGWTTFGGLAKLAGVSQPAITKARRAGRLDKAVREDARGPYIADPALALRELRENAAQASNSGKAAEAPANGRAASGPTLVEAQRAATLQRARSYELLNRVREGSLIDRATEERRDRERAKTIRDAVLAVPDRVASELAAETRRDRVHARLEEELRVALEALADVFEERAREEEREDLVGARAGGGAHAG